MPIWNEGVSVSVTVSAPARPSVAEGEFHTPQAGAVCRVPRGEHVVLSRPIWSAYSFHVVRGCPLNMDEAVTGPHSGLGSRRAGHDAVDDRG